MAEEDGINELEVVEDIKNNTKAIAQPELIPQKNLSPSSINSFLSCPRKYFYRYIAKLPEKLSIHLVKGSIVHTVLEYFFKYPKPDLKKNLIDIFEKEWERNQHTLKTLELTPEELGTTKTDCLNMIMEYYLVFLRKIEYLKSSGKAENDTHAFYLLKPKFREKFVKDEDLHCRGYIDRVSEDFDGILTLGDYKTSSKYGIGIPTEYRRQLAIYALLYYKQEKRLPDFVAVNFLRYGEEYLLEVTPSLLKYARNTIEDVYSKTRSVDIKDYPLNEGALCRWCPFQNICSGEDEWQSLLREKKLKAIIKEEEKKNAQTKKI